MDFTNLAHVPGDYEDIIAATLGDNIERALRARVSPFSKMMAKARDNAVDGIHALIDADLNTRVGIEEAKRFQAQAVRYRDLVIWIHNALEEAGVADENLDQEETEEPAIEQLKEQLHGKSSVKPAPDA